jgi:DNA polymerase-4
MARTIVHVDLDAFFCSVEMIHDPSLVGKPFVVGGSPEGRGVVASASYPARKFGVHSAMPTAKALRLCPDLLVVSGRRGEYGRYSKAVMAILEQAAPVIEKMSIDEAFLDLGTGEVDGEALAAGLQRKIMQELELPTSWGVASNKLVAKIASDLGKPKGLVVVPAGQEADFLAPLPVQRLWGVGPKTAEQLAKYGIKQIGDLTRIKPDRLSAMFGGRGAELAARARGEDDRPVVSEHEPKSMSAETTFSKDVNSAADLEATLLGLTEEVGRRLRQGGYAGSTVKLKLRWPDFTTLTRQQQLDQPTDLDDEIYEAAKALFYAAWRRGRPVRLIGVGVTDLGPPIRQLGLFDQSWQRDERLLKAVDEIRRKYGSSSLRRGGSRRRGRSGKD